MELADDEIFAELVDLPPDEWEVRLRELCCHDIDAQQRIGALLREAQRWEREPRPGQTVGRYRLIEEVGSGATGIVYRAFDKSLKRVVALKLLQVDHQTTHAGRLEREAQALAKIEHPNVVAVHDVGRLGERVYLAMEFVDGQTLRAWQAERSRSWSEVLRVYIDAARGLAAAHSGGLVHRDFKPDNVMISSETGRVRVLDFGLARPLDPRTEDPRLVHGEFHDLDNAATATDRTGEGARVGTPQYMPPEQALGAPATPQSDQFSFCVALWEALYGERPTPEMAFHGPVSSAPVLRLRVPSRAEGIPGWIRPVLERGLRREPEARWPSMEALIDALSRKAWYQRGGLSLGAVAIVATLGTAAATSNDQRPMMCRELADETQLWLASPHREALRELAESDDRHRGTFAHVEHSLLLRLKQLGEMGHDACARYERGRGEGRALRQIACVAEQRSSFAAIIEGLERPDAETIALFPERLSMLPRVGDCRPPKQPERCLGGQPFPDNPEAARRVLSMLDEATAALVAGRYEEALAASSTAAELAASEGLLPLRARARFVQGQAAYWSDDLDSAILALEDARSLAERESCDWLVARVLPTLTKALAGHRNRRGEAAERWSTLALEKLERVGATELESAEALNARAFVLHRVQRDPAGASEILARVIRTLEAATARDVLAISNARFEWALTLRDLGEPQRALVELQRAGQERASVLGENHPTMSRVEFQLGIEALREDQLDLAQTHLQRALELVEAGAGPTSVRAGEIHLALASIWDRRRDLVRAESEALVAVGIYAARLDPSDIRHFAALSVLAGEQVGLGRLDDARATLERARDVLGVTPNPTAQDFAELNLRMGSIYLSQREWAAAGERFRDAVSRLEAAPVAEKSPRALADAFIGLADAHFSAGEFDDARKAALRAHEIWGREAPDAEMLAYAARMIAMSACRGGHGDEAQAYLDQAFSYYAGLSSEHPRRQQAVAFVEKLNETCRQNG